MTLFQVEMRWSGPANVDDDRLCSLGGTYLVLASTYVDALLAVDQHVFKGQPKPADLRVTLEKVREGKVLRV